MVLIEERNFKYMDKCVNSLSHVLSIILKINLKNVVINVFVDIEAGKCVGCICE